MDALREMDSLLSKFTRIKSRLEDLRDDQESRERIYYAVDFSEIYSYFYPQPPKDFGFIERDSNYQHRLTLLHLFISFHEKLYILPPHTEELYNFIQVHRRIRREREKIQETLDELPEELKDIIDEIKEIEPPLSVETIQRFMNLIEKYFGAICVQVGDFMRQYRQTGDGGMLDSLAGLLGERLVYSPDNFFTDLNVEIPFPDLPGSDVVEQAFQAFPTDLRKSRPLAKLLDAQAVCYLDKLNHNLKQHNAKLLLVTRDAHMKEAFRRIHNSDSEEDLPSYFRSPETIFFDLLFRGNETAETQRKWLRNRISEVEEFIRNLEKLTLADLKKAKGRLLKDANKNWERMIDIELPMVFKEKSMDPQFPVNFPLGINWNDKNIPFRVRNNETFQKLKSLWVFLSRSDYRENALKESTDVVEDFLNDIKNLRFLNFITGSDARKLFTILLKNKELTGDEYSTVKSYITQSARFSILCTVCFVSEDYKYFLTKLEKWNPSNEKQTAEISKVIRSVLKKAVSPGVSPEKFLLMAFLLALGDFWKEAVVFAEKCLSLSQKNEVTTLSQEVHYFLALAKRYIGQGGSKDEKKELIKNYREAWEHIQKAIERTPDDPRYISEHASLILDMRHRFEEYEESEKKYITKNLPTQNDAMTVLRQLYSRKGLNPRLKTRILNNLVYQLLRRCVLHIEKEQKNEAKEIFEKATGYIRKFNDEFEKIIENPAYNHLERGPAHHNTYFLYCACSARMAEDYSRLEQLLKKYDTMIYDLRNKEDVSSAFGRNRDQVASWMTGLKPDTSATGIF